MEYYYGKRDDRMAFLQIADICEQLINGKLEAYNFNYGSSRFNICNGKNIKEKNDSLLAFYILCILCVLSNKKRIWYTKNETGRN